MGSLNLCLCWETFYKDREPVIFLSEVWTQYVNIPLCVLSAYNLTCLLVSRCKSWGVRLYLSSAFTCRLGPPKWPRLHPRRAIFPVATCNFRINRARNKLNAITHNLNLSRFLPCCSWRTMLRVCQLPSGWIFHLRLGCQTFFISSFLHTWFHSSTLRSFQIASSNIIFVAEETYLSVNISGRQGRKELYIIYFDHQKKPHC